LKEKKLHSFVESLDNNSNSALHLATLNGHTSIVSLLVDHGAETNLKNDENVTPLEMSCRKGFFEISKTLLENYEPTRHNDDDCPLHTACFEGAHEVVRVLLKKGALIDKLNHENRNCLDVAIGRGHREVVRVLLTDPNWAKLIRLNNVYNESECADDSDIATDIVSAKESKMKAQKYVESKLDKKASS
jgi:ankyrin repeat protein